MSSTSANLGNLSGVDLTGQVVGDFQVLRRLGQGGMGQVYLAQQLSLQRKVALKIMKAELASNETSLKRFEAEALAVAQATHANIVQVYATGQQNGLHYIALEYVDGLNLREYLAKKGSPSLQAILSIMRQVAAALQRAGELGIVHRDIKPDNILLTRKGEVKVADFGLSRILSEAAPNLNLTQSGVTLGTPLYMSPEQVEGKPLDPRSDIYSFGVTCYHVLAGNPPFQGQTAFEVALQHVQKQPKPLPEIRPDLPVDLCAIVHKMMDKDPAQRYQTGRELLKDLNRLRENLGGASQGHKTLQAGSFVPTKTMPAMPPVEEPLPYWQRPWVRWTVPGSLLLALFAGVALGWPRSRPSSPPPPPEPAPPVKLASEPAPHQSRELFLQTGVKQYADPGKDQGNVVLGLKLGIELAEFYLEQWRLEEADRFFHELIVNPHKVEAYSNLGRLGHAIVLAFKNQAAESNKLFLEVVDTRRAPLPRLQFLLNDPHFRPLIAKALHYNTVNLATAKDKDPLPPILQELRKPILIRPPSAKK